jgi:Na+/proline symporter
MIRISSPKNSLVSSIQGADAFILEAIFSTLCSFNQLSTPNLSKNKYRSYIKNKPENKSVNTG